MNTDPAISLTDKVALVTGAGGALGSAMSRALARAGAAVAGVDLHADRLERLDGEIRRECGGRLLALPADVGVWAQVEAAVAQAIRVLGRVDILVNNAGLFPVVSRPAGLGDGPFRFWEAEPEGYLRMLQVNAVGQFFMARAVTPQMLGRKWGRIVNISTSFDTMLRAGSSGYGPSKSAVEAQSAIWAEELAGSGVTVNVLLPGGRVDTTMPIPPIPKSGCLSPEIMAPPLPFLASDRAGGLTGMRITADAWDPALPLEEAAMRAASPVAWRALADEVSRRKGRNAG